MLQIVQHQKTGRLSVEELPPPQLRDGWVVVENHISLISPGTERSSVAVAQASLVEKARSRPDLVKQVLANAKREGLFTTYRKVRDRLNNYKELGYSSAGVVVSSGVDDISAGDRVACAGYAYHAEYVGVPKNLVVALPRELSFEEGAFTTLAAIALQGVRQAGVQIGETVAVIGLGMLGLITVQLLKSAGCRVVGIDVSNASFPLAESFGSDHCFVSDRSAARKAVSVTSGFGVDAVVITAGTLSNQPIELAIELSRKRGRIVVVGAVGMNIPRQLFYEKELELRIATSYGPGRYDADYEVKGIDYPYGYVRWTEKRNMKAVVDLMIQRKVDVRPLITHRFPIKEGLKAYDLITGKKKERYVGILIQYPLQTDPVQTKRLSIKHSESVIKPVQPMIGFIGAGNFAQAHLIPHVKSCGGNLIGLATSTPVKAKFIAERFGFSYCATDPRQIMDEGKINTVFIATRHDTHAQYVRDALGAGKNVFVEKPLALNDGELREIEKLVPRTGKNGRILFVGFNRRFSRPIREMRAFVDESAEPLVMTYRVNAGFLPRTHWTQDPQQGGRIIGEVCHFVDTLAYLANSDPVKVYAQCLEPRSQEGIPPDNLSVNVKYADGSLGTIVYVANGDVAVPKEYLEVSTSGKTAIMYDFTEVVFHDHGKQKARKYDGSKGHKEEISHFLDVIAGRRDPIWSVETAFAVTRTTFAINQSITSSTPVLL
jgi:predicted dehydrogenase/threonine dehydrogenase-like Zn-dependent dehydrogenase